MKKENEAFDQEEFVTLARQTTEGTSPAESHHWSAKLGKAMEVTSLQRFAQRVVQAMGVRWHTGGRSDGATMTTLA